MGMATKTCTKTYIFKLLPTAEQYKLLEETSKFYTSAYNDCISTLIKYPDISSATELQGYVYDSLREKYKGLNADYVCGVIRVSVETMKSQKALAKKGYKTAKRSPYSKHQSPRLTKHLYSFPKNGQKYISIATVGGRQKIPYQVRDLNLEYPVRVRSSNLVHDRKHKRFFLHVVVQYDVQLKPMQNAIGVDLGVEDVCVTYNDISQFEIVTDRNLRDVDKHFQKLRSDLQSKGTRSSKRRLKAIGAKQARLRRDVDHCISKSLVEYCVVNGLDTIVLEDLTGIRKNMRSGKKVNRKNHMWTFRRLGEFITYKAFDRGINVV